MWYYKHDDEKVVDGDIKVPVHLKELSKNFIIKIYVGNNFSLCLDKRSNLYC